MGLKLNIFVGVVSVVAAGLYFAPFQIGSYFVSIIYHLPKPVHSVKSETLYVSVPPFGSEAAGVTLRTDHYYPVSGEFPTVLLRTPYGIAARHGIAGSFTALQAYYLASLGYHVVMQSTRGRHDSTGEWKPAYYEKHDGKATLEWLGKQEWFNGVLGAWGASYFGYTAIALLDKDAPIQPRALAPMVTCRNFREGIHDTGAFDANIAIGWTLLTQNDQDIPKNIGTLEYWFRQVRGQRALLGSPKKVWDASLTVPINKADSAAIQKVVQPYQNFVNNDKKTDDFWMVQETSQAFSESDGDMYHIISAWYDVFITETIDMYEEQVKKGKNPYLTVYANDHMVLARTMFFYNEIIAWLNYKLKGDKSLLRPKPVAVHLMPQNEMIYLDSWPPAATPVTLYLSTSSGEFSGALVNNQQDIKAGKFEYIYDPLNPTPILYGNTLFFSGFGDNLPFLLKRQNEDKDVLIFVGPTIADDVIVGGTAEVTLSVSSSIAYSDFFVRLLDYNVAKNESTNVCEGFVRISPSTQSTKSGPFEAKVTLSPTMYTFAAGHKMMLQVCSGAHPRYTRNPGTGEDISTATKFVKAEQTVFVSPTQISKIVLPIFHP